MRQIDKSLGRSIYKKLAVYEDKYGRLKGISKAACRESFVEQLVESVRRIKFIDSMNWRNAPFHPDRPNPKGDIFDPYRGAIVLRQNGQIDEAFWLTFLSVHFGKNKRTKWGLLKAVYGGLEGSPIWTWDRVTTHQKDFRRWLKKNSTAIDDSGNFGNHRKYESKDEIADVVESYIRWIGPTSNHELMIKSAEESAGKNPRELFDYLYKSMKVAQFGRTGKFDYLTMIGKLKLANIEPKSTYMIGATGPYAGACLLFSGDISKKLNRNEVSSKLATLEKTLNFYFGMQILEDALCNWQKSPCVFEPFRG